ncbi:MAG: adenylosuccinate lyase [Anaerolineae bacterium]|nr:adenylosuccinate lyase [Anaerolineae bacterium]
MPAHVIDSLFFRDLFGTPVMRQVFDDITLLQKWLDFEAALARAQARLGMMPQAAADEITAQSRADFMDTDAIKQGIDKTVHPLVSMIWQLSNHCAGDAGRYVHWGATTQDVMDTAIVLQIRDALPLFEDSIARLKAAMSRLAREYRATPIAGRTHGQQALPTTFGAKVAVWLTELERQRQRLETSKPRVLVGEFGGAVGTLAGLAESNIDELAVQAALMRELDLGVPPIAWHTSRDGIVEFALIVVQLAALMGRIAHEIIDLQKQEFGEVEEPFEMGKVGSSTMPHKRNPMLCEAILTLARLCREKAATAVDTLVYNEHERDWSSFQMEWAYLPELCVMAHGALEITWRVLDGLIVYPDRMRRNLDLTGGLLLAERIMFALGEHVGRQAAHDIVYECAMHSVETQQVFLDVLCDDARVNAHLSRETITTLLEPTAYTGLAAQFVDRALEWTST